MLRRLKASLSCVREAYIVGIIIFAISLTGFFLVGRIYSNTLARGLIEAMIPAMQTLSFAVITSATTIVSLLMAVLGFARRMDNEFDHNFYTRIWFIATLATISLVAASLLLLMVSIPITEAESLRTWYKVIYWVIVFTASTMMAILVSIIVSLYRTLYGLIGLAAPEWETT